jgi:hypothetical protein
MEQKNILLQLVNLHHTQLFENLFLHDKNEHNQMGGIYEQGNEDI